MGTLFGLLYFLHFFVFFLGGGGWSALEMIHSCGGSTMAISKRKPARGTEFVDFTIHTRLDTQDKTVQAEAGICVMEPGRAI